MYHYVAPADTSSPDFTRSNALILVYMPHYELGAPCPNFSGLQEVPAYRLEFDSLIFLRAYPAVFLFLFTLTLL